MLNHPLTCEGRNLSFSPRLSFRKLYDSIIQNGFVMLKILWALPVHLPFFTAGNYSSFYCPRGIGFSRMSQRWNHTVCDLCRLPSLT